MDINKSFLVDHSGAPLTVTVLLPVYRVEKYIAKCAESLFAQTYPQIEYVFCDDCTPDRSIEVLQEVIENFPERKPHVHILRQEHNSGTGTVRARLLQEVRTDTFCFVDSDDFMPADAIETLVKRMTETGKDIIDGAYADYCNDKASMPMHRTHCSDDKFLRRVQCLNLENHCVWGRLYKTSVLQRLPDMFFDGIDCSEDFCATARISAVATRAWTDSLVYYYRTNPSSTFINTLNEKNMLSTLRAMAQVLRFYHMRGHLPMAMEIGVLHMYRECHKAAISPEVADRELKYVPEHFRAKLLYAMLHNDKLYKLGDFLYRLTRAIVAL